MNIMKKAILAKAKVGAKNPELRKKALKRLEELRVELDESSRKARQDLKLKEVPDGRAQPKGVLHRWRFWSGDV
jgi:hypothetical protein